LINSNTLHVSQFYPQSVNWGNVFVGAVGIAGDLIPLLQPAAESLEAIKITKAVYQVKGVADPIYDLTGYYPNSQSDYSDPYSTMLDAGSLLPTFGAIPGAITIFNEIGNGFSVKPYGEFWEKE
jgi:hypothetical protein